MSSNGSSLLHVLLSTLVISSIYCFIPIFPSSQRYLYKIKNNHQNRLYLENNNEIKTNDEFNKLIHSKLLECDTLISYELSSEYASKSANLGKQSVQYSCDAYTGTNIFQYLRIVKLVGGNYTILNIMGLPKYEKKSPILGIDLVSLPGMPYYYRHCYMFISYNL